MNISPPTNEGLRAPGSGPADPDTGTRKKMAFWDRGKFLLGLAIAFLILVWNNLAAFDGIMSFPEAVVYTASDRWGIVVFLLLGIEVLRQLAAQA